jgi:thiamine biosynthesis protein ThiS
MSLSLIINGQARVFEGLAAGTTVLRLVEVLGLKADRIALEIDGQIAPRKAWDTILLGDSQRIELVHFVGGGTNNASDTCIKVVKEEASGKM